jgi:hypothetical protein
VTTRSPGGGGDSALIAATNRQPLAGLLTALAYLIVATAVGLFVFQIISFVGHL